MGILKKILLLSLTILVCTFLIFSIYLYHWVHNPILTEDGFIEYYVPRGSSFKKIAYDLAQKKVINNPRLFIIYANIVANTKHIKYGTYKFINTDNPKTVLLKFIKGETVLIKITIPEGLNIYQVAQRLEKYYPTIPKEQWQALFTDPIYLQLTGLESNIKNLEGFLFPQTYLFDPHPEPQLIIKTILTEFKKNVTAQMFDKAKSMGLSPLQFITLASIIEKETSLKSERSRISAVYWNRLKKRMKLQADPTVIYGMWDKYFGILTKKDLLTPSLYNTYTSFGLPVGPIANPGIDSILAVINPENTEDIYFVANGLGGHIFSKTLNEHNRAVQHYIQLLREHSHR